MEENNMNTMDLSTENIRRNIFVVRGRQVMLDSDLALLYQIETKVLNQAVKRNISRFPEHYRFQLTSIEYENLKSQFVTSSLEESENNYGGRRKLPYVYTEQGIAMLSSVLRSDIAIQVNIKIIDTFIEIRKYMADTMYLFRKVTDLEARQIEDELKLETLEKSTEEQLTQVFNYIAQHEESAQKVFFDGQIYDAFSLLVDLIQKANKSIILIDGYVDVTTLNLFAKKKENCRITIYTKRNTKISETDIDTFNAQYPTLEVKYTEKFHDRFLILDNEITYHIGASLKDAGKKCFGITLIQDEAIVKEILLRLKKET